MSDSDQWDQAFAQARPAGKPADKDTPEPVYASVEAWVTEWFAPMIRRPTRSHLVWCPRWWEHGEALARLEALWRSWEALRLDGTTGMSVWWRDHCDPHLAFLRDDNQSPFADCRDGEHREFDELQVAPAPPGWWGDD